MSKSHLIPLLLVVSLMLSACVPPAGSFALPAAQSDSSVPVAWFKLALQLAKSAPGFTPPVTSRLFGYMGVTLYEAVVPGMPDHRSMVGQLNSMPTMPPVEPGMVYDWPIVANSALAEITRSLFPKITADPVVKIRNLESTLQIQLSASIMPAVVERSVGRGRAVASAVYAWSKTDGGHEGYLHNFDSEPARSAEPGQWQPTPPLFAPPMQSRWGYNRPLLLPTAEICAVIPPPDYSTDPVSQFYQEAKEVYETVRTLTEEQRAIALYWADDPGQTATPPGHSISIATQMVESHHSTLAQAAEVYARVGIALSDAFVSCWRTKFIYNVERPISYIQRVIDPTWDKEKVTDPVITPPFPEYTSGHSVASMATAVVLTGLFGDNVRFTDITHVDRGLPARTYESFYDAAEEAAISRLYGGIHYRSAIVNGMAEGRCVGERVMALSLLK